MANHVIPCEWGLPDNSGNAYFEPAAINFLANDRYPFDVAVFKDTATRVGIGFRVRVPQNYVGTPEFIVVWGTTATSGNFDCEIDYRAIAETESLDPTTDQENLQTTTAAPGTARLREDSVLAATAGNFAAGDEVLGTLFRDGSESDTIAAAVYVLGIYFKYADV